jgi:hypothetical protein
MSSMRIIRLGARGLGGRSTWTASTHPTTRAASTTPPSTQGQGRDARDARDLVLKPLTGNLDVDGLHRYDLDLLETVEWSKELLLKMKHNVPALQGGGPVLGSPLGRGGACSCNAHTHSPHPTPRTPPAMHVPYVAPGKGTPVCIEVVDVHSYDYTRPPPRNTRVTASFRVADLELEGRVRHNLLLLAGEHYDPYLDVVRVSRETSAEEATEPERDRAANMHAVMSVLAGLVREAKVRCVFLWAAHSRSSPIPLLS